MSIFCNYNIPIFPMTFGALTMGADGCSVPVCNNNDWFNEFAFSNSTNPFNFNSSYVNQPVFDFNNINTGQMSSGWLNSTNGWFNDLSFDMSNLKFDFSGLNTSLSSGYGDTFVRSSSMSGITKLTNVGGKMIPEGYNSSKGLEFANAVLKQAAGRTTGTGWCSKHVRLAMEEVGVYTSHPGSAADFIPILDKSPYFKKLTASNVNVQDLPAGCVLVYGRGVGGYSSQDGHIEVTTGDGRAASDFVHNVYKKPTAIYVPV